MTDVERRLEESEEDNAHQADFYYAEVERLKARIADLEAKLAKANKAATDTWHGWADGLRCIEVLEAQAEHLRRENDRLRATSGHCGGEPMVERRAQAHAEKEAGNA